MARHAMDATALALLLLAVVVGLCGATAKTGHWTVTDPNVNVTCIKLQAAITLRILCRDNSTLDIDVDSAADASESTCSSPNATTPTDTLVLRWHTGDKAEQTNRLTVTFEQANGTYDVVSGELDLDDAYAMKNVCVSEPDKVYGGDADDGLRRLSAGRSYMCASDAVKVAFRKGEPLDGFNMTLAAGAQLQAFAEHDKWLTADHCSGDARGSDIVPIIVGAALAALVVVVLVGYLIGRVRARRQGYSSV